MTKNTKILLGVAAAAGLGYYLFMKPKDSVTKNFKNFKDTPCKCHTGQDEGWYICGSGTTVSKSSGGECASRGKKAQQ